MAKLTNEFLEELFASLLDSQRVFDICFDNLKVEYLPDEYGLIWQAMKDFKLLHKTMPTYGHLFSELRKDEAVLKTLKSIRRVDLKDKHLEPILASLESFVRQAIFVSSHDELAQIYNRGDKQAAYDSFHKMSDKLANLSFTDLVFQKVFEGFDGRNLDRILNRDKEDDQKIPFGIPALDRITGGGGRGEATMLCGRTGSGKSFFLIHCGVVAAKLGYNVLHCQLEGTRRQVMDRYDANWTGSLYEEIKRGDEFDSAKMKRLQRVVKKIRGEVCVDAHERFESLTLAEARNKAYAVKKKHGKIDLIIVDYFELASPDAFSYRPDQERYRQDMLGQRMKALAVELNCHVLTVTQASNIPFALWNDIGFHITQEDLSEHKTKIKPFDIFITLNQTLDEKREGIARLYIDKLRDNEGTGTSIVICQNLKRSRFFDRARTLSEAALKHENMKEGIEKETRKVSRFSKFMDTEDS